MKKVLTVCLVLILCLAFMPVKAEPRYPDQSGVISDIANVLSQNMVDALNTFNKTLKDKTGAQLQVAIIHFLDGEDVKTYANTLFKRWGLGENDLLLLFAVGEDSYYTAVGSSIGKKLQENSRELLFTSEFRTHYLSQDYDGALYVYVPQLSRLLAKQYGVSLALPSYFGQTEVTQKPTAIATPKPQSDITGSSSFLNTHRQAETRLEQVERDYGVSSGKILILVIIFFLVLSPKRRVRKWGQRAGCSSCGCGCAPLGWLFALLGIRELFKKD